MKIYSATYDYLTLYGERYYGESYVGLDKDEAIKSLETDRLMEKNSSLIFDLRGDISKYVGEWEDGKFIQFIMSKIGD